nr:tRNA lysidine(34) synthetase TilS [Chthonobacter rhizosphaerae]
MFQGLADVGTLGVAVSGGPDSTALLHCLHRFAARRAPPPRLVVLTVDHGLRPGSAAEADAVCALARSLGHGAERLAWVHHDAPPASDLQARARAARYRLLAEAAAGAGCGAVALAHTLDDQAETFLMRLVRGSGVYGLAGMAPERVVDGMRFVRPLLAVPKARLVATCRAAGLAFVDDPSNADADRFLRARVRALAPALAAAGLTAEVLADTAARLARAAAALDRVTADLEAAAVTDHGGVVSVEAARLLAAPEEVALRLVSRQIRRIRPGDHPPRLAPLEAWWALVGAAAPADACRRTIAGVVLERRAGRIWLYAEAGRRGFPVVPVSAAGSVLWDGRIRLQVAGPVPPGTVIRAARGDERRPDLPPRAAASLPVVAPAEAAPEARNGNSISDFQ